MAADQLGIYNAALTQFIGTRKLTSLSENREPRRVLDDIWDYSFLSYCLEKGLWNFAMRTIRIDFDPDVEPSFGFQYAFNKPEDWVRTAVVASDEYFNNPLTAKQYRDETGNWFSSLQTIYVQYVSSDLEYGQNLALWPATFAHWVACELALRACTALSQDATKAQELERKSLRLLTDARSKDAMNNGTQFPPVGDWAATRGGWYGGWGSGWGRR